MCPSYDMYQGTLMFISMILICLITTGTNPDAVLNMVSTQFFNTKSPFSSFVFNKYFGADTLKL